ncbi:hypothetical protein D3C86_1905030 [compost metagenome]
MKPASQFGAKRCLTWPDTLWFSYGLSLGLARGACFVLIDEKPSVLNAEPVRLNEVSPTWPP